MLFNSYAFIFGFLPVAMVGFFLLALNSHRLAALWLVLASLFFYGCWNSAFVVLLIASISVNYAFAYVIGHARLTSEHQAKKVLTVAVVTNLSLLIYFKYANFFIANLSQLTGTELMVVNVVLPLGISFFTFTQIAFLVDVFRGNAREYNFIHYALFVTYFPHLIAGPVIHHKQMMPQFMQVETYRMSWEKLSAGLTIFVIGLAKKVFIADTMAQGASPFFKAASSGATPSLIEAWSGALCYTMQLYFDFSGYSDMAIGLSLCFGIALPINFSSPYRAVSIIEFWRRWHITLSQFLRDYLYIPLGGNRRGILQQYLNVFVVMLLGGIWHGAGWTFVAWGAIHGFLIVTNQLWSSLFRWRLPRGLGWALTFVTVVFAWVVFRAPDMNTVLNIWAGMCGLHGISLPPAIAEHFMRLDSIASVIPISAAGFGTTFNYWISGLALPFALFLATFMPNTQSIMGYRPESSPIISWQPSLGRAVAVGVLFSACLLKLNDVSEFLYFQF